MLETEIENKIEVIVKRKDILQALNFSSGIVEKKTIRPVLSNILISAFDNKLKIVATSLDISMSAEIGAEVHYPGMTTVNIVTFSDIVRKLNDENITLKFDANKDILEVIGRNFNSSLQTLPAHEFPSIDRIENAKNFSISTQKLLRIINNSEFAMSSEDTRYNLNGIFLSSSDGNILSSTALDGHRLATSSENCDDEIDENFGIIIPKKTVAEILKILKEFNAENIKAEISYDEYRLQLKVENLIITSKLIDATFPDYKNLIPVLDSIAITVNSKILADAVDRVSTINLEKFKAVKLKVNSEKIEISAFGESKGFAVEVLDNNLEESFIYEGEEVIFGFNPTYLLDILRKTGDSEVEIYVQNPNTPISLKSLNHENDRFIIMPIKV